MIALVISIIVMLILAGVSISAIVGDDGILSKAKIATTRSKFATYLEEFEMNKVDKMIDDGIYDELCLNIAKGSEELKRYIPSLPDEELNDFEIIAGYLIYLGDDEFLKETAVSLGMKDKNDQILYDNIGKEFAYYVATWETAKASGKVPASKLNLWISKDNVAMDDWREYAGIPVGKYDNEFQLDYGVISYIGTNEDRLMLLANSQNLREYIANGTLKLTNYVAPEDGTIIATEEGEKVINDWIIEDIGEEGAIKLVAIVGYTGNQKIITIPDTFNVVSGDSTQIYKVTTIKGDGTNNIFYRETDSFSPTKVTVGKGIKNIINKGLANLGANVQCHILYVGSDLTLGNDKSNDNVLGYEGIQGTCGSFTFVVPLSGNYTFKLWGASEYRPYGEDWGGLGGYSQGTVTLETNDKIYVYIGGAGTMTTASVDFEDGSCGYNGGGSGYSAFSAETCGGGGATDIRYSGTTVSEEKDCRILVAGGAGASDDLKSSSQNDGEGGAGGGTIYGLDSNGKIDKTLWSGKDGGFLREIPDGLDLYDCAGKAGKWNMNEDMYIAEGYRLFYGGSPQNTGSGNGGDMGGRWWRLLWWISVK